MITDLDLLILLVEQRREDLRREMESVRPAGEDG
jgi:hypothetical protein